MLSHFKRKIFDLWQHINCIQTQSAQKVCVGKMAAFVSSDSDSEFTGFSVEDLRLAEENYARVAQEQIEDISDMDISDFSDDEDENEDSEHDDPEPIQNGDAGQWRNQLNAIEINEFVGNVGPAQVLSDDKKEIDFFSQLFPPELFQFIADETNKYADKLQQEKGEDGNWRRTNAQEMRAFAGAQIVMGIIIAPDQHMYFSTDNLFKSTGLCDRFTRDRLLKLQQYFHVDDTSRNPPRRQPGHDKLAHTRHVLTVVNDRCKNAFHPHREASIDEAMIAYTGRLGFKQYVPMKPTKRGLKVWMRADPHNGYVNEFQVYTGREGAAERGLGERVVRDLSQSILGLNHHIYCDNYFSSVPLFEYLLENNTYACGTVRNNRKGLPAAVTKSKLKKQGECVQMQKGNMVSTAWHDKRTVFLLSTNADPTVQSEVTRKKKNGDVGNVPCPITLKNYTQHMNGVDRADQLRSTYAINRKALRWWKYLFWFLVDISICNGYVLMKASPNHQLRTKNGRTRQRTQLEFRMKLAHQLFGDYMGKRKRQRIVERPTAGLMHWPTEMKKRRCKQCQKNQIRCEPKSGCEQCEVNLCLTCFKPYHMDKHPELFS